MIHLSDKKCVACEGGTPTIAADEAKKLAAELNARWQLEEKKLWADLTFKNFKEAMAFINKVAEVAESEGHHPDIHIWWNKVKLELTTHAIGGLSENDFIMAAKIDRILTSG